MTPDLEFEVAAEFVTSTGEAETRLVKPAVAARKVAKITIVERSLGLVGFLVGHRRSSLENQMHSTRYLLYITGHPDGDLF